jgi:hypothetical protein
MRPDEKVRTLFFMATPTVFRERKETEKREIDQNGSNKFPPFSF